MVVIIIIISSSSSSSSIRDSFLLLTFMLYALPELSLIRLPSERSV